MKQFIKKFNNFIEKTIFKVQNKTNDNFKVSNFNKYLIIFIGLLFIYLFYLLIPLVYEKNWLQTQIEKKLLNEFKLNLSTSSDISYRILPAPHFLVKDSKIMISDSKNKSVADIKNLKIFINQKNFFNKKKLNIKEVIIDEANFLLLRNDLKLINEYKNNKFSNKKIKIKNSNVFLRDNLNEIILIVKIDEATLFFDNKKLLNLINLIGEVFNIPFIFDLEKKIDSTENKMININAPGLRLNIFNESNKSDQNAISGKNVISSLKSKIITKYEIKEKFVTFISDNSIINKSKADYNGKLSINPFDLDLNIYLDNYRISKLFDINPILTEFVKSELLFNDNISLNTSLTVESNAKEEIFQSAKINFHIMNGKIDLDKTRFISDDIGSLELRNSNLFFENNKLLFNSDVLVEIKNINNLFSFLNTGKSSRKNFKNILINLDYDFLSKQIKFNNITIDKEDVSDQLLPLVENFQDNNLNRGRRLINDLLNSYDG